MTEFDLTPDPKVLIALTHTPLQPLDALCELIDNAIDSFNAAKLQGLPSNSLSSLSNCPELRRLTAERVRSGCAITDLGLLLT